MRALANSLVPVLCVGALFSATGCERLVDLRLVLVEPCDQRQQALNGVGTFRLTVDGLGDPVQSTFTAESGPRPLDVRKTGNGAVVTVEAWEGNVEQTPSIVNQPPKSIGRSLPLDVEDDTPDQEVVLVMGRRDGLARATDGEGACQTMDNGHSITGRHGHTATFLSRINKVLIAGGAVFVDDAQSGQRAESYLRTAELFDPATGTFERLADMPLTRAYHTATELPDGRVLLVGGFGVIDGRISTLTAGLIFDPRAAKDNPWTDRVQFREARALHTATLLADQQMVVIIGGCSGAGCASTGARNPGGPGGRDPTLMNATVEIYDLTQGQAIPQPGVLLTPRAFHAVSALPGGRLLVSGGVNASGPVCDIEVLQTSGGNIVRIPELPGPSRFTACPSRHTQVTLGRNSLGRDRVAFIGGQVLAPGGVPQGPGSDQVVFWNSGDGLEVVQASLLSGRAGHASALLKDGSVLSVGGVVEAGGATAERLVPQSGGGDTYLSAPLSGPPLPEGRERAGVAILPTNQIFFSGGHTQALVSSDRAELYFGD